jgi:hypothetical protein
MGLREMNLARSWHRDIRVNAKRNRHYLNSWD